MTDVKRLQRQMNRQRKAMIKMIKRLVEPHMHDSGYKTGPSKDMDFSTSRHIRMWNPENPVKLKGLVLDEFMAISEFGPVTDVHGGGCVIGDFGDFPIEDIVKLYKWAVRTFPVPAATATSDATAAGTTDTDAAATLFKGSFFEALDKGSLGVQVSFNYDGGDGGSRCSKWFVDGAGRQIREAVLNCKIDDDYLRSRCDLEWSEITAFGVGCEDSQSPSL